MARDGCLEAAEEGVFSLFFHNPSTSKVSGAPRMGYAGSNESFTHWTAQDLGVFATWVG